MNSLLDLLHDHQHLRAKAQLDVPLDDHEAARLEGLAVLLAGGDGQAQGRRRASRALAPLRVSYTGRFGFVDGEIRNISAGGAAIATQQPLAAATRVLVHVQDSARAVEYVFPARVVWRELGARAAMGVAFEGVPSRVPIAPAAPARPRSITPSGVYLRDEGAPALIESTKRRTNGD